MLKWLSGLTVTGVLGFCGVVIHAPLLIYLGSETIPSPDLSPTGLLAGAVYAAIVLGVSLCSYQVLKEHPRHWLLVFVALTAAALTLLAFRSQMSGSTLGALVHPVVFVGLLFVLGAALRLLPNIQTTTSDLAGVATVATRSTPALLILLGATTTYSLFITPLLPPALGGIRPTVVIFPDVKKPGSLPMVSDTLSAPVQVLYFDGSAYWIRHQALLREGLTVQRFEKVDLGGYDVVTVDPRSFRFYRYRRWSVPYKPGGPKG
jgi:hypothetical protein